MTTRSSNSLPQADDARVHRGVVAREQRAVDEAQLVAETSVLRARRLAEQRLLTKIVDLSLQPRVLPLHVHEAGEVAVDIAERPCDALGRNLERSQDRRACGLHSVQRPGGRLPEGNRDQDEREQTEARYHGPAPEGGAVARRERLGSRSRYGRAQDRADAAVARHEASRLARLGAARRWPPRLARARKPRYAPA